MSQVNQAKQVKVVILGDSGVGKSSIMLRFVTGNFQTEREPTLGGAFMPKLVHHGSASIKYQIWDTAGQEKYHSLASMYYRDAQVAILVYDITKRESYESLKKWVSELRENGPKELMIAVVGNKTDLKDQEKVKEEEATSFSKEIRGLFMLTSAKEDKGVKELFDQIGEDLLKKDAESEQRNRIKLDEPVKKQPRQCCA